jgi:hypothetical protein
LTKWGKMGTGKYEEENVLFINEEEDGGAKD